MDPNAPSSGDHAAAAIPNPISCHPYFHPPATFYISQEDVSLRHAFFDLASATPEPLVAYRRAGPRGGLAVDPARAALVTCGGLCPGLNTVLRELVVDDSDDENGFAEEAGDKDMDDSFMESYSDALNKELRRVYKGKKMPGRMGGTKNKIRKLKIVKIDDDLRVLMIKGAVPGKPGNLLRIAPAKIVGNNIPKN